MRKGGVAWRGDGATSSGDSEVGVAVPWHRTVLRECISRSVDVVVADSGASSNSNDSLWTRFTTVPVSDRRAQAKRSVYRGYSFWYGATVRLELYL
jgi:hypothetical protein